MTEQALSVQERDRRWASVREHMAEAGIDVLVSFPEWVPGNSIYLANEDGTVIVPKDDEPTLLVARGDFEGVGQRWIDKVQAGVKGPDGARNGRRAAEFLAAANLPKGARVGVAGLSAGRYAAVRYPEGVAPYTSVKELADLLEGIEICDGTPVLDKARYIKGPEEIQALQRAVGYAERSVEAMVANARSGVRASSVYAKMMAAQLEAGSQYAYIVWRSGQWGGKAPRHTATPTGTIADGWFLNNEIAASDLNYGCQIGQPVSIGPAQTKATELFEAGKAAFQKACEVMRPGARWVDVEEAVKATSAGSPYKVEFLVHGRGLYRYSPMLADGDGPLIIPGGDRSELQNETIKENTTFVLKPFALLPGDKPELVGWGDTVVVEAGGVRRLGTRAHELITV